MKTISELCKKYTNLAKVAYHLGSKAEEEALHRIAMELTTSDPVTNILASISEAELDIISYPHLAIRYTRKIKWYNQAIAELLGV